MAADIDLTGLSPEQGVSHPRRIRRPLAAGTYSGPQSGPKSGLKRVRFLGITS